MVLNTSGVSIASGGTPTSKSMVALFLMTVPVGRFGLGLGSASYPLSDVLSRRKTSDFSHPGPPSGLNFRP
jgi:hypothetical protein